MNYTLITANRNYSSWSLRPWLLMRALGIGFIDRIEPFTADVNVAFKRFSPTGLVPVLIDSATTVADSLAIALYLAERHDGVWPGDRQARAWAQSVVCEMHSGFGALRHDCTMNVGVRARLNAVSPALAADVARIAAIFADGLDRFGGPWLAGDRFSVADAFFAPVAFRIHTYGLDVGEQGAEWVARILAYPAMREWETAALAETWREAGHEAELIAVASVMEDHRA